MNSLILGRGKRLKTEKLLQALGRGGAMLGIFLLLSPITSRADEIDSVCANAEQAQQKKQYCDAARSAQKAADASSVMWKVWAAVAGVCTAACVSSVAGGPTQELVCIGTNIAGSVTDAIVTKEFAGALVGLASAGASYGANALVNKGAEAGAKQKDVGACIAAASAGIQVYAKVSSMNASKDSAQASLKAARELGSDADGNAASTDEGLPGGSGTGGTSNGANGTTGGSSTVADSGSSSSSSGNCSSANTVGAHVSCALSNDPNFPAFVQSPKFVQEFQKDTGQNLGDFLNRADSPKQALASAMGSSLGAAQLPKLSAALSDAESKLGNSVDGATYMAGGGGGGSDGGGAGMDPALGEMMAGLLGQLTPKKEGDPAQQGLKNVIFANQRHSRGPAALTEDRTLNIFDRVTYRYYFVSQRIFGDVR